MWHLTCDIWHMSHDTWHFTGDRWGQTRKKTIFCELWILGIQKWLRRKKRVQITTNLKSRQNSINQMFTPCAFFFFLLKGATWHYHAIYIASTHFASFTGYGDDIFEVISNLPFERFKFGWKFDKFGRKSFFLIELRGYRTVCIFPVWGGGGVNLL